VQSAEDEVKAMIEEGRVMFQELEDLQEKIDNPGTAETAKEAFRAELEEKRERVRQKEAEVNQYRQTTQRTLQQRRQSIVNLHISEIKEVVNQVAEEKGADLVLNSNPNSMAVIYYNESLDITDADLTELNADKSAE